MAQYTEEDVLVAESVLLDAKEAKGDDTSGPAVDAYLEAANQLTQVRVGFRTQEESAGRRQGFVAGDAQTGGNN